MKRYRKEKNMSEDINTPNNGEELENIIVLNDEDGNEVNFEFLDLIDYEGEEYIVLYQQKKMKIMTKLLY